MMFRKLLSNKRKSKVYTQAHKASQALNASNAPICQLPLEIFLAITFQLSTDAKWCLASTCRTIYRLIAQCYPDAEKRREPLINRSILLRYWDICSRDLPEYLLCRVHTELYPWHPQQMVGYQCPQSSKISRYDEATPYLCYPPLRGYRRWHTGIYITEALRDLILRYHVHGPQWGLPASVLRHKCKGPISPAVYERKDIEGRIINGNLMVRTLTSHTFSIRRFKYWPVREEVYKATVCPHNPYEVWRVFQAAINHMIAAQGLQEDDFDARGNYRPTEKKVRFEERWYRCSTLLKCQWCDSDVRVSVRRLKLRELEIRFATYLNLGGSLSPLCRRRPRDIFFQRIRHTLHCHFGRTPDHYGKRLSCSLEDLYEEGQETACLALKLTHPDDNLRSNTDSIPPLTSNTLAPTSGFMANRWMCKDSEWMGNHSCETPPNMQIYAECFIRNYAVLQFELQP